MMDLLKFKRIDRGCAVMTDFPFRYKPANFITAIRELTECRIMKALSLDSQAWKMNSLMSTLKTV